MSRLPFELAHQMALLPLLWLAGLHLRGQKRDVAWWWLAGAFFVSWCADTASDFIAPSQRWVVMAVYPLSQSALVGFVFLLRKDAQRFVAVLFVAGVAAVLWRGTTGPDVLFRTVAWGAAVGIVFDRWALGRLRTSLLVYFGLGLIAWWGYALWPGWPSWGIYQTMRALGLALFCFAALNPGPLLAVVPRKVYRTA